MALLLAFLGAPGKISLLKMRCMDAWVGLVVVQRHGFVFELGARWDD